MSYEEYDTLIPQQHNPTPQYLSRVRIKIEEQPASIQPKFRYESETALRSVSSIRGTNSTPENKTFPTISVEGYQGRAQVVVSCVTKDMPYRPHPFKLVSKGRKDNRNGIIVLNNVSINGPDSLITLKNVGVNCVKKAHMEKSLIQRKYFGIDPFSTGFSHKKQPSSIDLNAVRLCFQVSLEGDIPGEFSVKVPPIVTNPIFSSKEMSNLSIVHLSDCTSSVEGGKKIILLCEKVVKGDIRVRFFEANNGWEAFADIRPTQIHKNVAIWFLTPRYKTTDVTNVVKVFIQLIRPSDGAISKPLPFELLPKYPDRPPLEPKIENPDEFMRQFQSFVAGSNNLNPSEIAGNVGFEASFSQGVGLGVYSPNIPLEIPTSRSNGDKLSQLNSDELDILAKEVDHQSPLPNLSFSSSL